MFLKFFDNKNPLTLILLFFFTVILWLKAFISPIYYTNTGFSNIFFTKFLSLIICYKYLPVIFAFIIVLLQGFYLNKIVNDNKIILKQNFQTGLIYITLISFYPQYLTLTPVLLSNLFFLIALNNIFKIFNEKDAFPQIFNIGFFTAIASLFYIPSAFFLILIFISFIVYQLFRWRDWVVALLGFFIPYLFVAVYYFYNDKLYYILSEYQYFINSVSLTVPHLNTLYIIFLIFFGALFLFSLYKLISTNQEKLVKIRSNNNVLVWFLFISIISVFVNYDFVMQSLLITIPFSVIVSNYLTTFKKRVYPEIIYAVLLSIVIVLRFI